MRHVGQQLQTGISQPGDPASLLSRSRDLIRLRHANPLHDVDEELVGLRPGIEQALLDFYPQLDRHVREWRSTTGDRIVAADD